MSKPAVVVARSYLIGSIPFAGLLARFARNVDLREVGSGTVSGTGLYRVAGWQMLFVGGTLDLLKGTLVVLLVDRADPGLRATAAVAVVAGHNWSGFLRGAGGRGLSPALGATLVQAPEATAVLGAGLAAGKLAGQTGLGSFVAQAVLPWVLWRRRGNRGLVLGIALTAVMWLKRIAGNSRSPEGGIVNYGRRLFLDHD